MIKRFATGIVLPTIVVAMVLAAALMAPSPARWLGFAGVNAVYNTNCTSAHVDAAPLSLATEGSNVTLTASSTNCATPQYKFWLQPPGGVWTAVSGYGGPTFVWNTTGARDGVWGIGVWARETGHTAPYEAYYIGSYRILANCISATLTATPNSPQARGTVITLKGFSTLCSQPRYRFWILTHVRPHWSSFGPYSTSDTKTWNTAGYAKGAYRIGVWARQVNSTHTYDAYNIITFYVT